MLSTFLSSRLRVATALLVLVSTTSTSQAATAGEQPSSSLVQLPSRGGSAKTMADAAPEAPPHWKTVKPMEERHGADSLEFLAADVTKVLKELRTEENDPTVHKMFHSKIRPTFAVTWTHDMWDQHTSRWRYVNLILYWYNSALLKRLVPQMTCLMIWTIFAIQMIDRYEQFTGITVPFTDQSLASIIMSIKVPLTSLSLVSGFVGSLLALRSNQGLARLMEARMAFGKVVLYTRDMSSLVSHFVYPRDPELGLKLARHLATFSWLLKHFLRSRKVRGSDEDLIRTMLCKADADYVMIQRKMPVAVVMRLRQALAHLGHKHVLSTAEELSIDHTIQSMDQAIMVCERIVASPIPPLFTTHAGRLLIFYLFFLPLALHSSGQMNAIGTFVTVLAVGYAMLGLDEISHLMEQPFKLAPLYHLCKNSMRDVTDSFCLREPSLDDSKNHKYAPQKMTYWPEGVYTGLE